VVVMVVVNVNDATFEDHGMQSDDVVCLDIGQQAQEDDTGSFDQYHIYIASM